MSEFVVIELKTGELFVGRSLINGWEIARPEGRYIEMYWVAFNHLKFDYLKEEGYEVLGEL